MKVSKDHSVAFSWCGIIGVAAFIIAWVSAATIDTSWEFAVNTLSEFGISDTNARYFFNYGCLITGALVAIFGFGHTLSAKNGGHTAGGILLVIGGIFLALIGVITMDVGNGNLHNYVAGGMGLFIFLGMVAIGAGNWFAGRKMFAGITLIFACIIIALVVTCTVAELEAYGIMIAMVWFILESIRMIISSGKD